MFKGSSTPAKPYLFLLLLALEMPAAQALEQATLEQARSHIEAVLSEELTEPDRMQIRFSASHSRLELEPCGRPLRFDSGRPLRPGRFSLKASCDYPKRWSLRINGEIEVYSPVLVSSRALPRGSRLSAANTEVREQEVSGLHAGFYRSQEVARGYQTIRTIRRGDVITPRDLTPPLAVFKGDEVTIIAGTGGLEIRVTGVALEDGRRQQQIQVRNKTSDQVIRARVIDRGLVRAGP